MTRSEILAAAEALINGDRAEAYGDARESFSRIARFWAAYLGVDIGPDDVALMMVLLKVSRAAGRTASDDLVDIAGYAALAEELA